MTMGGSLDDTATMCSGGLSRVEVAQPGRHRGVLFTGPTRETRLARMHMSGTRRSSSYSGLAGHSTLPSGHRSMPLGGVPRLVAQREAVVEVMRYTARSRSVY